MAAFDALKTQLQSTPKTWLITGVAGFIGSNLLEALLKLDQHVTGLDNFATGREKNHAQVQAAVSPEQWARFRFKRGDIRDLMTCHTVCKDIDYVLHQAALGSVPRSLEDPLATHAANNTGFLNILIAARDAKVKRFVYAASSSTYGDHPGLPKVEDVIGKPLSPYAVTKLVNELYADVFGRCYGMEPSACVTSISSAAGRILTALTPLSCPNGCRAWYITSRCTSTATAKPAETFATSTMSSRLTCLPPPARMRTP